MKVAMVSPMKSYGGIERTFVTLAAEFDKRGIASTFAMLRDSQVPYPSELGEYISVRDLDTRSKRDGIAKVARFVRSERPDAIITGKDHGAQTVLLSRMIYRWRALVFVTVSNMWSHVVRRPIQRRFVRWLYPKADGIIAVSKGVKEDLCKTYGLAETGVRVIYNPVSRCSEQPEGTASVPHAWLGSGAEVPVILGIGRLEMAKDFPTLVRAFARLRQKVPCRLIILGEGSQREQLTSLAGELGIDGDVDLAGQVESAEPYLRRAALFVLSSRWEGFGIVIAEALAAGTPVVAADCDSGPAEILDYGRYGRLVPVGDDAAMAEAMRRMLDDPPSREVLIQAAERFAPDRIADAYLDYMGLDCQAA